MKQISTFRSSFSTFKYVLAAGLLIGTLGSCSKSKDDEPTVTYDDDHTPIDENMLNKVILAKNIGVESNSSNSTLITKVLFSLEKNQLIDLTKDKSNRWDISVGSTFDSFIGGNNGKDAKNLAAGGSGIGGVICLKKPFNEVIDIPKDADFQTGSHLIGTDDLGDLGAGIGYYIYDFDGKIKGDGSEEKKHVAYAMPEDRTIVVKTAKGNYAKIQVLSLYKDLMNPADWKRNSPHTFLTFNYMLAKAGSTKFATSKKEEM